MPLTDLQLDGFKTQKSILPTFRFLGEFYTLNGSYKIEQIKPWHILSVAYEQHTFKQEGQYHGPGILKTFPVLDRGEAGAYRLTIIFEEDKDGTIINFIESLKANIINSNGIYRSLKDSKDLEFWLHVIAEPEYIVKFQEVYFQTADGNEHSYGNGDAKIYTVSLAYDNYEILQLK